MNHRKASNSPKPLTLNPREVRCLKWPGTARRLLGIRWSASARLSEGAAVIQGSGFRVPVFCSSEYPAVTIGLDAKGFRVQQWFRILDCELKYVEIRGA